MLISQLIISLSILKSNPISRSKYTVFSMVLFNACLMVMDQFIEKHSCARVVQ